MDSYILELIQNDESEQGEEAPDIHLFRKLETWLTALLDELQVSQSVNLSEFRSKHKIDRGTFSIVLSVLEFFNIITTMGKSVHRTAQLKSSHRLLHPIKLHSIVSEIHRLSQTKINDITIE